MTVCHKKVMLCYSLGVLCFLNSGVLHGIQAPSTGTGTGTQYPVPSTVPVSSQPNGGENWFHYRALRTQIWKNHIEYEIGLLERLGNGIHEPTHRVWLFSFETNFKTGAWPQLLQFGKLNEDLINLERVRCCWW